MLENYILQFGERLGDELSYSWAIEYVHNLSNSRRHPHEENVSFEYGTSGWRWLLSIEQISGGPGMGDWMLCMEFFNQTSMHTRDNGLFHPFWVTFKDGSNRHLWSSSVMVAEEKFCPSTINLLLPSSKLIFPIESQDSERVTMSLAFFCETPFGLAELCTYSAGMLPNDKDEGTTQICHEELDSNVQSSSALKAMDEDLTELSENFKALLLETNDADVTLKVSGRTFKAHQVILKARSAVFNKMFQHEMVERKSGMVEITDCDPDAFEVFLQYIYSGHLNQIHENNVSKLYYIANKYDIEKLSQKCVSFMKSNITVDTFGDFISAVMLVCEESNFLEDAVQFFSDNFEEIGNSAKWKEFFKQNPILANELIVQAHLKFASKGTSEVIKQKKRKKRKR